MKDWKIILIGVLVLATLSCRFLSPDTRTDEESIYENDAFSFTIPADWKMALFGGDYYDLNVEKVVTIYDNPIMFWSKAFFTVATSPLDGELETRFVQTYEGIELWDPLSIDVKSQAYKQGALSGLEFSYTFAYGEGVYNFHDIWVEKGGFVYVLSFRTRQGEFNNYTDIFEEILDSFRFKE